MRGYTELGYGLGIAATALFLLVGLYAWRKRRGQESTPGRLSFWLRLHLWFSVLAVGLALLHAGFHVDGGTGTFTLLALAAALLSGVGGYWLYRSVPPQVARQVHNLAQHDTRKRLDQLTAELEDSAAGRSDAYKQRLARALGEAGPEMQLPPDEIRAWEATQKLLDQRNDLRQRLTRQQTLHRKLRSWLWLHIPAAVVFLVLIPLHIYDAAELRWLHDTAGPRDYDSPEQCAECHRDQYNEWIGSMHALAMSSPVTELQNRLVLLKEQRELQPGQTPVVGDLCVKCHAPTGSLGKPEDREDPLTPVKDLSPTSQMGVSCVTCHQVQSVEAGDPTIDPDGLAYKNIENLHWTQGRRMLGPLGDSVGNSRHRGEQLPDFLSADFCASCHTVAVDLPDTKQRVVKLQDTYSEWRAGGPTVNWSQTTNCMNCHGGPLPQLAALALQLEQQQVPLADRLPLLHQAINQAPNGLGPTADAAGGFDQPILRQRRFRHTFTGVDYHLEAALPYLPGHANETDNPVVQEQTVLEVQALLRIAAAVDIRGLEGNRLEVDVMNLATGHHLPAGFAFAREMWLEVAVDEGDGFRVVVGGLDGRPLGPTERLDKTVPGLKNFQGVLFNKDTGREVVLQNEANAVLFGSKANEAGFTDRQQFLLPGEIRTVSLDLSDVANPRAVRVRLLFRNYPIEFIEGLADKFIAEGEPDNEARTRALIGRLRIHEMARDTLTLTALDPGR